MKSEISEPDNHEWPAWPANTTLLTVYNPAALMLYYLM